MDTVEHPRLGQWTDILAQALDDDATEVDAAEVVIGFSFGVAWFLHDANTAKWWSCYYNDAAGDMHYDADDPDSYKRECWRHHTGETVDTVLYPCPCEQCEAARDPAEYLSALYGATDWERWRWESYDEIPIVY